MIYSLEFINFSEKFKEPVTLRCTQDKRQEINFRRIREFNKGRACLPFIFDTWEEGEDLKLIMDSYYDFIKDNVYTLICSLHDRGSMVINKKDIIQFNHSFDLENLRYQTRPGHYNIITPQLNNSATFSEFFLKDDPISSLNTFTRLYNFRVEDINTKKLTLKPLPFDDFKL